MRTADSDDLLHLCLCSTANQPQRFRIFLCGARHVISHLLEFAYTCYRPCTATWLPRVIRRGKKDWLSYSTGNIKSLIPSFSLSLSLCHIFSLSFSLSLLVFSLSLSRSCSLSLFTDCCYWRQIFIICFVGRHVGMDSPNMSVWWTVWDFIQPETFYIDPIYNSLCI